MYDYYINFLRNKNPFAILAIAIRSAEDTEYNHVEISKVLKTDKSKEIFYSAVMPVSRKATKSQIEEHYKIVKRRKLNVVVTDSEAYLELESNLGKKYSILQNIVILLKLKLHVFRNYFASVKLNLSKYLNCTEYCGDFIQNCCDKKFPSTEALSLKDLDKDEIGILDVEV